MTTILVERRKKTEESVDTYSIEMKGQRLIIRIISAEYLMPQKENKYKYEVLSEKSEYYGKVDMVYSYEFLKAGHMYKVAFNKNNKNPRIVKVIKEIEQEEKEAAFLEFSS